MNPRGLYPYLPAFLALVVVAFLDSPSNDKFQFWYAGHLVATGRSPYDTAAWADASSFGPQAALVARNCADAASASCRWIYVPWLAWLYAPFGLLDPAVGMLAISAVLLVASATGVVLIGREAGLRGPQAMVFGLCAALCAPYVWNTFLGHFGALELIGAALASAALRARRAGALVAGGVLLSLKPHLFLVLIPAAAAWLATRRTWRVLAIAGASLGLLALVGIASDARFVAALGAAGEKASGLVLPTTWSLAARTPPSFVVVALALVAVAALAAWIVVRSRPAPLAFVGVSMALSLVVAPYLHLYDHVVLLPAVAAAIAAWQVAGGGGRYVGWAIAVGFVVVEWIAFLGGPHGDEPAWTALIPILVLVALAASVSRGRAALGAQV